MSELGEFEINFLKCVEKVLASVPSNLSLDAKSIWFSTLIDCYSHLRDIVYLLYNNCHGSD